MCLPQVVWLELSSQTLRLGLTNGCYSRLGQILYMVKYMEREFGERALNGDKN